MLEVALFPIPDTVAFPGVIIPLHIFEPRYRRLVNDCVQSNRMIGISHVNKVIRKAPTQQSVEDALQTNQATYKPQSVFSAGLCEVHSVLDDGRILAEVHVEKRLQLIEETQTLPYQIVTCELLEDLEEPADQQTCEILKSRIRSALSTIVAADNPEIVDELKQPHWLSMTPSEFSFAIFQVLRFDSHAMQLILESRSAHERLLMINAALESA